ncbi:MAG: DUF4388 domain-containing protein [Myxococcota bacterium]|nr:DUF4388 domain-containing protein [Myxococcota bacterium]
MAVALHGNLRDFGVGEVFQLIGHQRKTGVLEVVGEPSPIRIAFDRGAVVRGEPAGAFEGAALADMLVRVGLLTPERRLELDDEGADGDALELLNREIGREAVERVVDLLTQETLFDLLRREKGSFHFTAGPVPHRRDPSRLLPAEQILMDGLRMVDEWRALDAAATRDHTVFERASDFDAFREQCSNESPESLAAAERLYLLVDGRIPARRVIDLSRMGSFEAARWMSRLHESGIIRVREELAPGPAQLGARPRFDPFRLAALVPFVLLLIVAGMIGARVGTGSPSTQPARLTPDPLDAARSAAATTRLSRLLEARRFSADGIPVNVERLGRAGVPPLELAAGSRPPYYFRRRGGSHVLLAPDSFAVGERPSSSGPDTTRGPVDRGSRGGPIESGPQVGRFPGEPAEPRRTGPRAQP